MYTELNKKVDALFSEWDGINSPGCALLVMRDGNIIHSRGFGSANLEYDIPITPESIFHVASVSKQFTCFAIALLDSEGQLNLDDEVKDHLPYFPDFGRKITIRHLCHHVSGLRDQWELLMMAGWRLDDVITLDHILKMVRNQKELNFEPGSEYLYSNTGYTLLAEIVAKVSGQSFRQFCHERIFAPLGMTSTHFHDDHEEIVRNRAYSYQPGDISGFKKSVLSYANVGATSLFTTTKDLGLWLNNLDDMLIGGEKVHETMHTRFTLNNGELINYALGLSFTEHKGLEIIGHSGADAGYRSFAGRVLQQGLGIVILSNLSTFTPYQMALKVAEVYLADVLNEQDSPPKGPDADLPVEAFKGKYHVTWPGYIVSIDSQGNNLTAQIDDGPRETLEPQGALQYLLPSRRLVLTFVKNEEDEVTHFNIPVGAMTLSALKVADLTFDGDEIVEYCGEYYSEELGTAYNIYYAANEFTLSHRRNPDNALVPIDVGQFQTLKRGNKLSFVRKDGQVVGFRLTGGRVRDLWFSKK